MFSGKTELPSSKAKSKGSRKLEIVTLATIILMTIQKTDICFDPSSDFFFFFLIVTVEIAVKAPGKLTITWDGTPLDRTQHGMVLVDYQEDMENKRYLYSEAV